MNMIGWVLITAIFMWIWRGLREIELTCCGDEITGIVKDIGI
jgi:hypothetical protein